MLNTKKKKLGLWMLSGLVTGNMVGSGIFMLPANLAAFGSISLLGWIFTGIGAVLLALVFARLSLFAPEKSGGPYTYAREGLGEFVGFQTGYCYWVNTWVGNAAIALVAVGYFNFFFPVMSNAYATTFSAIALIWALTFFNTCNIRLIGGFQLTTTILKLLPLILILAFGWKYLHPSYLTSHFNISGKSDFSAFSASASIALWSFIGLESATIVGENVENPARNVPLATIIGTLTATFIYVACSLFMMSIIPATELQHSSAPFADVAKMLFGPVGVIVVAIGAIIACVGTLNGLILLQGQVAMAKADDGLFPKVFSQRNKHGLPARGQYLTAFLITSILLMTVSSKLNQQFQFIALVATSMAVVAYFYTSLAEIVLLCRENKKISIFNKNILIAIAAAAYSLWAFAGAGQEVIFYGTLFLLTSILIYSWILFYRYKNSPVTE